MLTRSARAAAERTTAEAAASGHWQAATGALVADVLAELVAEVAAIRAAIEKASDR